MFDPINRAGREPVRRQASAVAVLVVGIPGGAATAVFLTFAPGSVLPPTSGAAGQRQASLAQACTHVCRQS
jgi:hypothetical protein